MSVPIRVLESHCRGVGRLIGSSLPDGVGFAVLVFEFGEGGHLSYVSNANREDMIRQLRELADRLEAGTANTRGAVS